MSPLLAFGTNPIEIVIIAVVVLLLFGNRLPGAMRSLGRGFIEFKKGVSGVEDDVEEGSTTSKSVTKPS